MAAPDGLEDKGGDTTVRAPRAALSIKDFEVEKVLGAGSFAQVLQAKLNRTGKSYALKIMDKRHIVKQGKAEYVLRERRVLDALRHEGLINLCFTFQDPHSLYLGLELCTKGELFDQIQERGQLPMDDVRFYSAQIVLVLEFLHKKGVVHRDLKPENLLLTDEGHLKLGDFGSVKLLQDVEMVAAGTEYDRSAEPERKTSFVGTAEYASPEVLNGGMASTAMDWWSFGCLFYQMIVSKPPFRGGSQYLTFQKIEQMDYHMPGVGVMPLEAADLVRRLLVEDPKQRLGYNGVEEIKAHAFFEGVDWSRVWEMTPPVPVEITRQEGDSEDEQDFLEIAPTEASHGHVRDLAGGQEQRGRGATAAFLWSGDDHHEAQGDSIWTGILADDETIIKEGKVKKYKGMFYKKRILLLTDKARLVYLDPSNMQPKGEIPLDRELEVAVKSDHAFTVKHGKDSYVMDTQGQRDAVEWVESIKEMQDFINS